jgi:ParB family chromosome partitioning protein
MAKLGVNNAAGWNAGKTFYAKTMRVEDIVVDPEISSVFLYKDYMVQEITESIRRDGFHKEEPISVWEHDGRSVVLDGHTRLAAAAAAGLSEVPVVVIEFEDKEDAILYTFERQVVRRNLTANEILIAVEFMMARPGHKKHDGHGRSAQILAKRLGVGKSTITQAQRVLKEAPVEDVEAIRKGEKSLSGVYNQNFVLPRAVKNKVEAKSAPVEIKKPVIPKSVTDSKALRILDNVLTTIKMIVSEAEEANVEIDDKTYFKQLRADIMTDLKSCIDDLSEVKEIIKQERLAAADCSINGTNNP